MHWWLPNNENYPSIVQSIRKFVEERTTPARDTTSEDLRDMKTIFSALKLDEDQGKDDADTDCQKSDVKFDSSQIENIETPNINEEFWDEQQRAGVFGIEKLGRR